MVMHGPGKAGPQGHPSSILGPGVRKKEVLIKQSLEDNNA